MTNLKTCISDNMIIKPLPKLMEKDFDRDSLVYFNDNEIYYNLDFSTSILTDIQNNNVQIYTGYYDPPVKGTTNSPVIFLIGRGKNCGKFKIKIQGFYPYCYIKSEKGEFKDYLGTRVEKVIFKGMEPKSVAYFRDRKAKAGYPIPYEADILFVRRFLIDTYDLFKSNEILKPKVAILDVETNNPISDDIISYAMNNPDGELVYESKFDNMSSSEMSFNIMKILDDFDIVTGWFIEFDVEAVENDLVEINKLLNFARNGYNYDVSTYIDNLMKSDRKFGREEIEKLIDLLIKYNYLKLEDNIIKLGKIKFLPRLKHHLAILDMLTVSRKMHASEIRGKWTLGNVGSQLVGLDKIHTGARHINDLSEDELFEYNVRDTIIPELIDKHLGGIQTHIILAWSIQAILEDVILPAVVNDIALIRAYHRAGIVLPTRHWDEKDKKIKYKAAEPVARPGIYDGLIVTDLEHAYPWAVISKNVSPETKDKSGENIVKYKDKEGNEKEVRFNNDRSIFIDTLKEIMEERGKIKKSMQEVDSLSDEYKRLKSIDFALKTQAAAFSHGIFGWANSRMRDYEVADAITGIVRNLIDVIKDACDAISKPWVYVHTDSCFVNALESEMKGMIGYLNDIIIDYSEDSKVLPILNIKGYYPKAYIHSPARNVLIPDISKIDNYPMDPDAWNVTGCNFMRSEVPEELADIEIELLKRKMKGNSIEDIKKYLKDRINSIVKIESTKLGLIKPLTKPINEYGRTLKNGNHGGYPGHINALLRANEEYDFTIKVGEKFMVLPVLTDEFEGKKVIRRKRVDLAFPIENGLPENYQIDYEYYLRSNLWGKIYGLFDMKPKQLEREIIDEDMRIKFGLEEYDEKLFVENL